MTEEIQMKNPAFDAQDADVLWGASGSMEHATMKRSITLSSSVGDLVPAFSSEDETRKKLAPVKFYPDGGLRAVPLE